MSIKGEAIRPGPTAFRPARPGADTIEKAYIRGLREGERRGEGRRLELLADKNELIIRLKTAKGEAKRLRSKKCICGDLHAANCPLYVNHYGGGHAV